MLYTHTHTHHRQTHLSSHDFPEILPNGSEGWGRKADGFSHSDNGGNLVKNDQFFLAWDFSVSIIESLKHCWQGI